MRKAILGLCSVLVFATAAAVADEDPAGKDQRLSEAMPSIRSDAGKSEKKLFFGYVEFDWDPDVPGGVHGFGPLPNTASQVAVAKTEPGNATRRSNRQEE